MSSYVILPSNSMPPARALSATKAFHSASSLPLCAQLRSPLTPEKYPSSVTLLKTTNLRICSSPSWRLIQRLTVCDSATSGLEGCRQARGAVGPDTGRSGSSRARDRLADPGQLAMLRLVESRVGEVEVLQGLNDHVGHDDPGEPLVVGRNDVPGGPLSAGGGDHLFVGTRIILPEVSLLGVGRRELPVLVRVVQPRQQPLLLFLSRDVQEELPDDRAVPGQMALEGVDVVVPLFPDALRYELAREHLRLEDLAVNADDEDFLIVRAVEDADDAPLRQVPGRAPEKIVVELLGRGFLEGVDLHALRVDTGQDVFDRSILARGVHPLEDEQKSPPVLRGELVLQLQQLLQALYQECPGLVLGQIKAVRIGRIPLLEPESPAPANAVAIDDLAFRLLHGAAILTCPDALRLTVFLPPV